MAFVEGERVRGWGVFRGEPWHFDSIHPTRAAARARAKALGKGYQVQRGDHWVGTDNFIYGNIDLTALNGRDTTGMIQHRLTLGDKPITWRGRQLAFSTPADSEARQPPDVPSALTGAAFAGGAFAGDAFATADEAEDDGIYLKDEPLPDISDFDIDEVGADEEKGTELPALPLSQTFLTDESGNFLTDEDGNFLIADAPAPEDGEPVATTASQESVDELRQEMLARLDGLEALLSQQLAARGHRGHNHPPELLDIESPVTQEEFQEVTAAIAEIRRESESVLPDRANVERQVSIFRRIAQGIGHPASWGVAAAIGGVIGNRADAAFLAYKPHLLAALGTAADAVMTWLNHVLL